MPNRYRPVPDLRYRPVSDKRPPVVLVERVLSAPLIRPDAVAVGPGAARQPVVVPHRGGGRAARRTC